MPLTLIESFQRLNAHLNAGEFEAAAEFLAPNPRIKRGHESFAAKTPQDARNLMRMMRYGFHGPHLDHTTIKMLPLPIDESPVASIAVEWLAWDINNDYLGSTVIRYDCSFDETRRMLITSAEVVSHSAPGEIAILPWEQDT